MKTFITLCLLLLATATMAADSSDIENNFLGLEWGARLDDNLDLRSLYKKERVEYYYKPNEVRTLDNFKIGHVVYGFYREQFFAAYVKIEALEVFNAVKNYTTAKYGDPRVSFRMEETTYVWKHKKIKIKMKVSEDHTKMKLAFYYLPLSHSINEEQLEKNHNRSIRFLPIEKDKKPSGLPLLVF